MAKTKKELLDPRQALHISYLKPNPNNPRLIKDDKFKKLVDSIKEDPEFLEAREIIVNKDYIILGGNMRYKAAKEAGITEVPVKMVDWSEEKQRRFIIKDNVSGGEWDWDILANEWEAEELEAWGLDTPDSWNEPDEIVEDESPEVTEDPVSELGKIYQLGRHRVMCGDSTDKTNVELLMNGNKADMVFTDPPYGMNYSGRGKDTNNTILGDNIDPTEFYNLGIEIEERYVWGRIENYKHLKEEPRDTIIWKKNNFGMGRGYRGQYECCFYYGNFNGSDSDVWDISKDTAYEHPTQKPVALCARAIKNSKPTNIIDYFLGSGSTLIASEQTNRTCYGMELDPKYVDVIRKRYAKFIQPDNQLPDNWEELTPEVGND